MKLATTALVAQALYSVEASTCETIKRSYQDSRCCNSNLGMETEFTITASPPPTLAGPNPCAGAQPTDPYFDNINCTTFQGVVAALEQAGANVTEGYTGLIDATSRPPISTPYWQNGLCPVNVHWHLGTEHYSAGQYDEHGTGPASDSHRRLSQRKGSSEEFAQLVKDQFDEKGYRRLSASDDIRMGFQCRHYDAHQPMYTTPYNWQYCTNMEVGQTYEVHWPHSAAGACGTPNQYQSPFYDGLFCTPGIITLDDPSTPHTNELNTYTKIGVQGQVFTIVNNESYYYPDLIRGMIVDGTMGRDITAYTGSTTGTSRSNEVCSRYTPITWQVDRTCHLISASSFDKMCMDMLAQRDDMSSDVYPHGSRELVASFIAANNQDHGATGRARK